LLMHYMVSKETSIDFEYTGSSQEPSITLLAPIKNNNDPLHLTLGNPDLRPGFNQNFKVDLHHFKTWLVNVTAIFGLASTSIGTKTITDSLGRQVSQPVNVDGGKNAAVNLIMERRVLEFDMALHGMGTYGRTVSYINADLSRNDAYSGGGGLSLNKYMQGKYSLQLDFKFTYFDQVSSINTAAPVRYWTQSHMVAVTFYFIKDFEINTNTVYTWQQKNSSFSGNTSVMLWNAYFSHDFLRGRLVGKFQVNNILNASAGISRTNMANINTQSSTNTIGRYWMISAAWHFDRKFKSR